MRALLIFLYLVASSKINAQLCKDVLALPANDPAWLRLIVRHPDTPLLDEGYPKRAQDSLLTVFKPWFLETQNRVPFQEMQRQAHTILVGGLDGSAVYQGGSRREHGVATPYIVAPGAYRFDAGTEGGGFSFLFRWDWHIGNDFPRRLWPLLRRYREQNPHWRAIEPRGRSLDSLELQTPVTDSFFLSRVREPVQIQNSIYGSYVRHHYPSVKSAYLILQAMSEVMDEIHALYHGPESQSEINRWRVLRLLSEYIHLAANAHMFTGANFSVAMNETNYILSLWDLNGISHSNLDYLSMLVPCDDLHERFVRDVANSNPDATWLVMLASPLQAGESPFSAPLLLGHFSMIGDTVFEGGELIAHPTEPLQLEGVMASVDLLPPGVNLSYMGYLSEVGDTEWVSAGTYMGTRGQTRALEGVAFRLSGAHSNLFTILYQARSAGEEWTPVCSDGEFCGTRGQSKPITGLKVWFEYSNR